MSEPTLAEPATEARARPAPAGRRLRVGVWGNFGTANLGNEGSLTAFVETLKRIAPDAELTCICFGESTAAAELGLPMIPFKLLPAPGANEHGPLRVFAWAVRRMRGYLRALKIAAQFDMILVAGTGLLDDFCDSPSGMPWVCFKWFSAARLRGTPVALVSIGAGPIIHPLSKLFMISAAKLATWRSYRDQESKDFLRDAGVDVSRDEVTPDIAFGLKAMPAAPACDTLTVGIGVMLYKGWRDNGDAIYAGYIDKLKRLALKQMRAGRRVRLYIGQNSDDVAVQALLSAIRAEDPALATQIKYEPAGSLDILMAQMADADAVVATRFHNVVCALKMGKPTISLGYAKKNDVLLADMGLGVFAANADDFEYDWLDERLETMLAQRDALSRTIRARLSKYTLQLNAQEERLRVELERAR